VRDNKLMPINANEKLTHNRFVWYKHRTNGSR